MACLRWNVLPSTQNKMLVSRCRTLHICGKRHGGTQKRRELRGEALRLSGRTARRAIPIQEATREEDKIRVAVVDDDQDMRQLIKAIVERTGACTCVGSFADAEKALVGIPDLVPDVVLMDVQMPGRLVGPKKIGWVTHAAPLRLALNGILVTKMPYSRKLPFTRRGLWRFRSPHKL